MQYALKVLSQITEEAAHSDGAILGASCTYST